MFIRGHSLGSMGMNSWEFEASIVSAWRRIRAEERYEKEVEREAELRDQRILAGLERIKETASE